MVTGAEAGNRTDVVSYTAGTGTLVLTPFGGSPGDGETYQILPKDAGAVVQLWENRAITLITTEAVIEATSSGTKVQIASKITGEAASVEVAGGNGNLVLGFTNIPKLGVDGYRHWAGLLQVTQWTVDGRIDDPDTYPGIRAAGVQVEVIEPVKRPVRIEVDVTPNEGVTLSSVAQEVKSAISSYVNTLPVGGDVIVSEITVAVKGTTGVFDVTVNDPLDNIAIADSELARIAESDIIVG
jgi:hypothetical protein